MDNVKRILVPIDSSEIAERAMQQAIKINRRSSYFICSRY